MSRLAEIVEHDLEKLKSDKIEITPEELIWLNDLGRTVENPQGRTSPIWAGAPIKAGGFNFWTLTLQSSAWFRGVACRFFTTEKELHHALAFASIYGRDEALPDYAMARTFETLNNEPDARKTLARFAKRFRGNQKELQSALFRLMPDLDAPYPLPAESSDLDDDSLLADLLAGTGLSRDYWQCQHSDFVFEVILAMYKQCAIEAGGGGDGEDHEYKAAMMEYQKAYKAIRDAHTKGTDNAIE